MKRYFCIVLCCCILLLSGCRTDQQKYKRISFDSDALADEMKQIDENTVVINGVKETFPAKLPIYNITERNITDQEYQQMLQNLGLTEQCYHVEREGNYLNYDLASYMDFSRGYFELTDEELEKLAWETFNKIPFMEGEYEYIGIRHTMSVENYEGETHITRAGVSFYRVLDGVRVSGEENCTLYFDGSGLVEIDVRLFDYEKVGTMRIVSLEDAEARIKTPDDFSLDNTIGSVNTLQVDSVKMYLVNQYSRECEILLPIYIFYGTAYFDNEKESEFKSYVIAIPESMTYEE